ncbi:hypothetical protein EYC59_00030 [Candidatus Saccharibacteria bacterium]|nr:MAG: hypothetical protein EYC59_00030 [Candidatus Saccharibacteria bacterium]
MEEEQSDTTPATEKQGKHVKHRRFLKPLLWAVGLAIFAVCAFFGYAYAVSPAVIRNPRLEHYHFRMQILVNGRAENFGSKAYQTGYSKDQCNADLPEQPIHFHDNKDQFVHIHWNGMTGGMVMKYYGWNFIGGMPNALGYMLKNPTHPEKVTIHGNYLPAIPKDTKFYVYTGDEKSFKERNFEDWKTQDLEQFFGQRSNFPGNDTQSGLLEKLFPKASAHVTEVEHASENETETERLTRLNNLIGNVVIFVQPTKPSDQQVKARFDMLLPLSDSTCGG